MIEKWGLHNEDASFIDSIGIFLAVALATLVGFFSERKSAKEFEALNKIKEDVPIKVVRDGQLDKISIHDIVVGDVVRLDSGDKLPADGVLLETTNLYVDQATFTGESVPVRKAPTSDAWNLEALAASAKLGNDDFVARHDRRRRSRLVSCYARWRRDRNGQDSRRAFTVGIDDSETPDAETRQVGALISAVGVSAATLIFTIASLRRVQIGRRPELFAKRQPAAVVAISVLWAPLERFAAKPFFKSIGVPVKSKLVAAIAALPRACRLHNLPAPGE